MGRWWSIRICSIPIPMTARHLFVVVMVIKLMIRMSSFAITMIIMIMVVV